MKLSEAMRLGSMDTIQCFGQLSRGRHPGYLTGHPIATCAMGAALHAVGWPQWNHIDEMFPICGVIAEWPMPGYPPGGARVGAIITTLNDTYKWSREQIADWVATIEQELEREHADCAGSARTDGAVREDRQSVLA